MVATVEQHDPERQRLADFFTAAKDAAAKLKGAKDQVKELKAVYDERMSDLNDFVEAMVNAERQPTLFDRFAAAEVVAEVAAAVAGDGSGADSDGDQGDAKPRPVRYSTKPPPQLPDLNPDPEPTILTTSDPAAGTLPPAIPSADHARPARAIWGQPGMFTVDINDGSVVTVLYTPDRRPDPINYRDRVECWGEPGVLSANGYYEGSIDHAGHDRPRRVELAEWVRELCQRRADERRRGGV